ncbi:MAG: CopG family transcriptional regulator [Gammaproteobacteria bacterium]|nr:CopG family transcriptional regulator [Gammaproteobacteria bacterium]
MRGFFTTLAFVAAFTATSAMAASITVYKSPACGCCAYYAAYLVRHGFQVDVRHTYELDEKRRELGVPQHLASCHTAIIEGYRVEGHVPVAAIARLLQQRPAIAGIAVPGMPANSPGMGRHEANTLPVYEISPQAPARLFGTF